MEIVTNTTAQALWVVTSQLDESRTAILQLQMGLDYVLVKQGRMCNALNLTKVVCCFNISDNGEAIRSLADHMEAVAHVPVQSWEGWNLDCLS